jgi:hypothetical protein
MDLGQSIIIGLSILMGLWYIVGASINRKRGIATYHWIHKGLETTGKVSEGRWIGSSGSGARLTVGKADRPFHRVEVVFLLDSREILPLWLVNLLRNKQDEMILKANLRSMPTAEVEVGRTGTREMKGLLSGAETAPFESVASTTGIEILSRGKADEAQLAQLRSFIEKHSNAIKRISLQRQQPHLILRANLPPLREEEAEAFFNDLKAWLAG